MSEQEITFSFGANWKRFVGEKFDPERLEIARRHLLGFLGRQDLRGVHFLDVGSGSGLSSLAAFDSGADRVVSFDVDPLSVEASRSLRRLRGDPPNWTVQHGSILDDDFVRSLEPADVVYSWGVLHHTGEMWRAVANAARLMKPGGLFYLALYTTTHKSPYWIRTKKRYNAVGPVGKRLMELQYFLRHTVVMQLLARRNPISFVRNYKQGRGMAYWVDVRDWLGGYPYEDATVDEVVEHTRRLGLELIKIATGEACTEYLLQSKGGSLPAVTPAGS
jgi:2-polyprenyl-6-hydroxyphenyl methylase/3-demethylubiquinone-9 3-methyltransferase